MTKIIFIDIDGVLNREDTIYIAEIDPDLVAILKKIVSKTKAKIVLSSTWRLSEISRNKVKEYIKFIDVTPDFGLKPRGEEIASWLNKHPEVEKYAILDDDSDMRPGQPLFQTTWEKGLTEEIAQQVIKHLNS
jgi:hypothetical protein